MVCQKNFAWTASSFLPWPLTSFKLKASLDLKRDKEVSKFGANHVTFPAASLISFITILSEELNQKSGKLDQSTSSCQTEAERRLLKVCRTLAHELQQLNPKGYADVYFAEDKTTHRHVFTGKSIEKEVAKPAHNLSLRFTVFRFVINYLQETIPDQFLRFLIHEIGRIENDLKLLASLYEDAKHDVWNQQAKASAQGPSPDDATLDVTVFS